MANTGRKILSPLKVTQPFSLKLGAPRKASMYGFGRLSGMVRFKLPRPTLVIGRLTEASRRLPGRPY